MFVNLFFCISECYFVDVGYDGLFDNFLGDFFGYDFIEVVIGFGVFSDFFFD